MISEEQRQFEGMAKQARKLCDATRKLRDEVMGTHGRRVDPHRSHESMLVVIAILLGVVEAHFEFEARSCPPVDEPEDIKP